MTFFQIADEYERDFEELELEDLEDCAFATLLYVQLGHLSAKRMTDGLITPAMLRKRTAAWSPAALDEALASLVRLGKVERRTDGGVQFVDWDLTQFTAEQEAKRRSHAAERQRRRRQKLREEAAHVTIAENDNVTRDVTPPSASSSEEEEKRREEEPPTGVRTAPLPPAPARGPKSTRPKADEKRALLKRVLVAAGLRHGFVAEKLMSAKYESDVIQKAAAFATREGVELETVLARIADEAWERHETTGKDLKWCVVDWQPNAAPRRSWGRPRLEIAPCSPRDAFGSEEEAWEKLRQRQAENAAAAALKQQRKEVRHVGT